VLERAKSAGVEYIINPGIDVGSSQKAITLAQTYPVIYAAVGLHPEDLTDSWQTDLNVIKSLLPNPRIVAIGEIGLDTYHQQVPIDLQIPAFQAQLDLARERRLPCIIHSRNTLTEILPILSAWSAGNHAVGWMPPYGVMHSFEGGFADAEYFLNIGLFIGLTGPVTYKNARLKMELALSVPMDKLLLETDSPYLPPVPHRGERNEPAYLPQIGKRTAIIRGCEEEVIMRNTSCNAISLFHLGVNQ
jgi:TatD DNase family protein